MADIGIEPSAIYIEVERTVSKYIQKKDRKEK
jgi:hypothetical protein